MSRSYSWHRWSFWSRFWQKIYWGRCDWHHPEIRSWSPCLSRNGCSGAHGPHHSRSLEVSKRKLFWLLTYGLHIGRSLLCSAKMQRLFTKYRYFLNENEPNPRKIIIQKLFYFWKIPRSPISRRGSSRQVGILETEHLAAEVSNFFLHRPPFEQNRVVVFCFGMPCNLSFYHPGPIEG